VEHSFRNALTGLGHSDVSQSDHTTLKYCNLTSFELVLVEAC
jgi:hypothetical protein